jgi:thiol-disulfide isomerase/thioredoxin
MYFAEKFFKHLLIVLCVFLSACQSASYEQISKRTPAINGMPKTNQPMPVANPDKLGWRLLDGRRQTLADFKGKAVVLDFWATYCPPCLEGIPHFVELQKRHQADGLQVVGLHVGGEEDKPKISAFVKKMQIQYELGYPENELSNFLLNDNTAIPQTFVFDRNGQLVQKFVGFDDLIKQQIDSAVQQALK